MKIAFSTLGVPGMPVAQVVRLAADHRFHGVELRAHATEEPVHTALSATERAAVVRQFEEAGVEVLGVGSYVKVAASGEDEPVLAELRAHVALAADLGAPYVRVFPGAAEATTGADAVAARRLAAVAPYALDREVRILVETHDSHRTAADVQRILGLVGHRAVGALWDVMHTWLGGEQPSASYPTLAPHLGYVQVKDIASAEDRTPLPLGQGVLPLTECVEVLSRDDWDGWLCWEYEKRWFPAVPELPGLLDGARGHLGRLLNESA
ncbi:sugar phosphate isomerase/epimerase family protein [Streptantibioticus rubrisoli]|uniref:Sugar phosphate isomerase/epimerase n=1 Tax=Streptantibioticus rubrisoli TaxID=1387313 RepID=A0ABT1PJY3_9ACTN|nr:sugar phosphate isomerase/epimerase family protein [Streptantibioticus rubrisoli]MCQ4044580.1 sugar phosphate isomerase/epimerase [Streptantibioticus rubrisoli]